MLIALAGLPGSGKSVLAHALQGALQVAMKFPLQVAIEDAVERALPAVILDIRPGAGRPFSS